jgi:NAD(P)-dependent dehydrogenase (short-subunit alcohol dehydrogenase family)
VSAGQEDVADGRGNRYWWGRGIGRAIADALGKANFAVARVSLEDQEQASIPAVDRYYRCDVSNIAQHDALLDRIAGELGEPSCLVNNAGVTSLQRGDILNLGPDSYDPDAGHQPSGWLFPHPRRKASGINHLHWLG